MGTLFEEFQILCTDYDYILGKRGDIIQRRTFYKGGHYSRKYGMANIVCKKCFFFQVKIKKKVTETVDLHSTR